MEKKSQYTVLLSKKKKNQVTQTLFDVNMYQEEGWGAPWWLSLLSD